MIRALGYIFLGLIILIAGWHIVFWLLGGTIALGASAWAVLVSSIVLFSGAIVGLFIVTGIGIFAIGITAFVWTVIAIALLPVLFPILLPLLVVTAIVSYYRGKENGTIKKHNA